MEKIFFLQLLPPSHGFIGFSLKEISFRIKSQDKQKENQVSESDIPIEDLEMFENVAFVMAKHAAQKKGQDFPNNVYDWLDQFDTFSIYTILPEIVKLWNLNTQTQAEAKKNFGQVAGK